MKFKNTIVRKDWRIIIIARTFIIIMNLKNQANYSKFLDNLSHEKGKRDGKLD